jgi:hypothetical protein
MRPEPQYRAPPVALKLEAARSNLLALEADLGQAVLDAEENAPNAARRLAVLRSQIIDAERAVTEYTKAHTLAARLDRQSDAATRATMRAEQRTAFLKHGKERLSAAEEILTAAAAMSSAMQRYGVATRQMVAVKPIGTALPIMSLGPNGIYGGALGNLELLLTSEFYRLGAGLEPFNGQRFYIPFAKQPTLGSTDHRAMQPGMDAFRDAHEAIVKEIEGQIAKIDAEDMNVAAGEPVAMKGPA